MEHDCEPWRWLCLSTLPEVGEAHRSLLPEAPSEVRGQHLLDPVERRQEQPHSIQASRTSLGTFPADSQWTRNPIAPCWGDVGGASTPFQFPEINQCKRTQFPAILQDVVPARPPYFPLPGLYGYGVGSIGRAIAWDYFTDRFKFHIVDKVHVPEELPAGEYVLSWRWDVEQSPQVWANCADITIVDPEGEVIV